MDFDQRNIQSFIDTFGKNFRLEILRNFRKEKIKKRIILLEFGNVN